MLANIYKCLQLYNVDYQCTVIRGYNETVDIFLDNIVTYVHNQHQIKGAQIYIKVQFFKTLIIKLYF